MEITKRGIKEALGFTTDVQLANYFGVIKQAVSNWPMDKPIPQARQWQLQAMRPDLFPKPKAVKKIRLTY